jgi:hypothetical protein
MLSQQARAKRCQYMREYMKKWRRKNPEKVREMNRRYWERLAEENQEAGVRTK